MKNKWTAEEIELLYKIYPNEPTNIVKKSFNRTWDAIKIRANILKIKRNVVDTRMGDLSNLILDKEESYYWIGFIMADGCINHDAYRLIMVLAIKDVKHLEKFSNYIKCKFTVNNKVKHKYAKVAIQDKIIIKQIIKKFNFISYKTINPPNDIINNMPNNLALSFITGFIDGDGCIKKVYKRKDSILTIKVHNTWLPFLIDIKNKLEFLLDIKIKLPKINNRGYAVLNIGNIKSLRLLKNKVKTLNIPYMSRKWDIIDENMISSYETANNLKTEIHKLLLTKIKKSEIAKKLNISSSCVTYHSKSFNN